MLQDRIRAHFQASVETKQATLPLVLPELVRASELLLRALRRGNKLLICGNGGSAADAQHFAAELTGRFEQDRQGLPCIALTTDTSALTSIANDYGYEQIFSRQVTALARAGDLLLALSTSGNSPNVLKAVEAAHAQGVEVIALTGRGGGKIAASLRASDIELRVAGDSTARIQETHILFLHCLCDAVDAGLTSQRAGA